MWCTARCGGWPAGATAPDGRELHVDYYRVYGPVARATPRPSPNRVSAAQDVWESDMLDNRHLVLRGENASAVMKLRSCLYETFVLAYRERRIAAVSPPAFVQTQVEGGSTLFKGALLQRGRLPDPVVAAVPRDVPCPAWATSTASRSRSAPRRA